MVGSIIMISQYTKVFHNSVVIFYILHVLDNNLLRSTQKIDRVCECVNRMRMFGLIM